MMSDLAFIFLEVLLVFLVIYRMIEEENKQNRREKPFLSAVF